MKLRKKFFLILLAFSLAPLGLVTILLQRATTRAGVAVSYEVSQDLSRVADSALLVTVENSAKIISQSKNAVELGLAGLALEAEALFDRPPSGSAKVYFSTDFDDPGRAPLDAGPKAGYMKKTADGRLVNDFVSFDYPVITLAPGLARPAVQNDIMRLVGLTPALKRLAARLGSALQWVYASTESGVHISFPGHGGYPADYDPRRRPWYVNASDEVSWNLPAVDATSGQVVMTASRRLRHADGSPAGVAAMDILITRVLRIDLLAARWTSTIQSLLVTPVAGPAPQATRLLILAQKDYEAQSGSWEGSATPRYLTSENLELQGQIERDITHGQPGLLEMPYRGVDSIWVFAPVDSRSTLVVIAPRSVIERLPQRAAGMIQKYTNEQLLAIALTASGALLLATLAAFLGSRSFTRPISQLIAAVGRLSRGDFSARVLVRTGDERDQLIEAFNRVGPRLADQVRLRESLKLATEVQQNLLPRHEPCLPGLDIAGASLYCDETGGDYYDYITIPTHSADGLAVVVADVSGHGVYAALLMASARAALRLRAALPGTAAEIVSDVNRQFTRDVGDSGAFMTLFYLVVEESRAVRWVRAGQDPAMIYDAQSGLFGELGGRGVPLGLDEEASFEEKARGPLTLGSLIFIGTDGIWETADADGRLFGKEALREIIRRQAGQSAHEVVHAVLAALASFRQGRKPADDTTMVVIKIL